MCTHTYTYTHTASVVAIVSNKLSNMKRLAISVKERPIKAYASYVLVRRKKDTRDTLESGSEKCVI